MRANVLIFLLCLVGVLKAQPPTVLMHTGTVTNCRAFFHDDGGPTNPYNQVIPSGSTQTLVIITGNPLITMTFNPNSPPTQIQIGDNIRFHSGTPATAGNLIAGPFTNVPISGTLANVTSNTGTLVVVWTENGNTNGHGWSGGWFSTAPAPATPATTLVSWPSCSASVIQMTTTAPILCDSLKNNFFNITGPPPFFPVISTVQAVGCNNGTCTAYNIFVNNPPGLNQNCNYSINATLFAKDKCDSIYKYPNLVSTFSIGSCPISAQLTVTSTNTVCAYSCSANVMALVPSSVCLNLAYSWTPALPPTAGPHTVCPSVTTVYQCSISAGANSTLVTNTIVVIDPQINAHPLSVCQGNNFNFSGSPAGGTWLGPGITNTATGAFCSGCTTAGVKTITYQVGNCLATTQITIIAINAGGPEAACVGQPNFTVSGGTPAGGTWYGDPHITSGGVFTPSAVGTYTVVYTVGTCTTPPKQIVVSNAIVVPTVAVDVCKSQWYRYFFTGHGISPFGGRYYGPGIINSVLGTFSPAAVPAGTYAITYSLSSGCSATFAVNVLDILVTPPAATTCPTRAPFIPPGFALPSGGTWSCSTPGSILNATTGLYSPSVTSVLNHTDVLVYTAPNGCPDTISMRCIRTDIDEDSLFYCMSSNTIQLNSFANYSYAPTGGIFNGTAGVTLASGNYIFNPATANVGIHTIKYDINTCLDSVKIVVYPNVVTVPDRTLCSTHPTIALVTPPLLPGTMWGGAPGVTTPSLGILTPSIPPAGASYPGNLYTYTFTTKGIPSGCSTGSANIYVYQFVPADISNLNPYYCYRNQDYTFNTVPPNGTLTAVSSITPNTLNPSVVGAGQYTVMYGFGTGACFDEDTVVVRIWPQLTTTATISNPTICIGESSKLDVKASGGLPTVLQYTYTWSHTLTAQSYHNVVPFATTVYTCITSDNCSDPVIDQFTVLVHPNYYPAFVTPTIQCYGTAAQVTTNITPSTGPYTYTWTTLPVQNGPVLSGIAGKNYFLKIRNTNTGCTKDTSIVIPGWPVIQALFSPEPNLSCIPFEQNNVSFLDLSNGALSGTWNFNGTTTSYTPGVTVSHEFKDPGSYNVTLDVVNQGNCPSTYAWSICILESTEIFLPDIFSPNNDGTNDVLFVRGNGIKEMKFQLYDRWGNKVFESTKADSGWDGKYNGKDAEPGVYAFYLDATLYTDKKIVRKGDITLVR